MLIEAITKTFNGSGHCEEHGDFTYIGQRRGSIIVGDQCPHCLKARLKRNEELIAKEEAEKRRDALSAKLKASGIPQVFMDATFDNYNTKCDEATKARGLAVRYASNFAKEEVFGRGIGILMRGAQGSGKTHIACAIMRSIIEQGFAARYTTAAMLLARINEAPFAQGESRMTTEAAMQPYITPHLLVIDDLDIRTGTSNDYRSLFMVIDHRWANGLPMIAISNRPYDEICKEWGDRTISRIINGGLKLNFTWDSMRGKRRG